MKNTINHQKGFTLIETLMAMAIFTIGILGLFGMQTAVIKQNLAANTITSGATWSADQVERIIGLPYLDPALNISRHPVLNRDLNCLELYDFDVFTGAAQLAGNVITSGNIEPVYTIYWNVVHDCTLVDIPDAPAAQPQNEQKPKYIRTITTRTNENGQEVEAAVFDYIKQNRRMN